MKALNIYIRTSLTGPCIKDGCWAAAIEYQTRKGPAVKGICGAEKETTYYRLVLLGIVESLKTLNTACHVTLYTDCIFIKNMIETETGAVETVRVEKAIWKGYQESRIMAAVSGTGRTA